MPERTPLIPGLQNWLGFRHAYIPIQHRRHLAGKSSYTFLKRLRLATESIISFSDLPLRLAGVVGSALAILGLLLGIALIAQRMFLGGALPGYTSTIAVIVVLGGTNLMFLGMIGVRRRRSCQAQENSRANRSSYKVATPHTVYTNTAMKAVAIKWAG